MRLKVGFSKDGLTLNSKKFHPLNMPLKGVQIESDIPVEPVNASEVLSVFQRPDIRSASRMEGIDILRQMIEKAR